MIHPQPCSDLVAEQEGESRSCQVPGQCPSSPSPNGSIFAKTTLMCFPTECHVFRTPTRFPKPAMKLNFIPQVTFREQVDPCTAIWRFTIPGVSQGQHSPGGCCPFYSWYLQVLAKGMRQTDGHLSGLLCAAWT